MDWVLGDLFCAVEWINIMTAERDMSQAAISGSLLWTLRASIWVLENWRKRLQCLRVVYRAKR